MSTRLDLTIVQGESFATPDNATFIVVDENGSVVDLTGFSVLAEIRQHESGALVDSFTGTVPSAAAGKFRLSLDADETAALPFGRVLVYDVEIRSGSIRYKPLHGSVFIQGDVTRVA